MNKKKKCRQYYYFNAHKFPDCRWYLPLTPVALRRGFSMQIKPNNYSGSNHTAVKGVGKNNSVCQ
jgi:hypothetical protein